MRECTALSSEAASILPVNGQITALCTPARPMRRQKKSEECPSGYYHTPPPLGRSPLSAEEIIGMPFGVLPHSPSRLARQAWQRTKKSEECPSGRVGQNIISKKVRHELSGCEKSNGAGRERCAGAGVCRAGWADRCGGKGKGVATQQRRVDAADGGRVASTEDKRSHRTR